MSRAVKSGVVAAILIAALGIRVWHVQSHAYRLKNDAYVYLRLGGEIADQGSYSPHDRGAGGSRGPTAYFPPAYPYFLAGVDLLDGQSHPLLDAVHPARLSQAALGTVIVALVGLVAFELFGWTAALIALALAAFYPVLIEMSSTLAAENLLSALVLAAVYAGLRVRRASQPASAYGWIVGAGVLTGLAALTHENGILILFPLIAAVWTRAPRLRPRSLIAPATLLAATALTIAPWAIRNAITLHRFIPISDETGITLVGTYNPESAAYQPVPYKWRIYYGIPQDHSLIRQARQLTEPQLSDRLQSQALSYIGRHPTAPLTVAWHNTLRMFELEGAVAWRDSAKAQSIPDSTARLGVTSFWILCGLAVAGAFSKLTRAAPKWVWFVPLLLALSVVLVNVETPRFRAPVDPFLILPASAGLASGAAWLRRRLLRDRPPVGREARDAVPAGSGQLVEVRERLA
ncbi:MAG: glycosyltransferase family 39 protein [Solirubrobacterales bacterium]|nr:glycosyltransferase family 39 protein [Solirubrobacterales bacterium]